MRRSSPPSRGGRWSSWLASCATLVAAAAVVATFGAAGSSAGSTDQIDAQRAGIRALEEELLRIEAQAAAAADAASVARSRGIALQDVIRRNTAELRGARVAHTEAQQRLAARLKAAYTERTPDFVELVVASGSIAGAVNAEETLERVRQQDAQLVVGIEESQARLREARRGLVAGRAEAERQEREAAVQLDELARLGGARAAVLDQARASLEQLIVEEQVRRERLAAIAAAEAEAAAALQARAAAVPAPSADGVAAPAPVAPAGPPPSGDVLDGIAQCESGGNPAAVSPGGTYRGKYQFHPETWRAVGGAGDPAAAPESEQDRRAALLYARRGSSPWPICGA